MTIQGAARKARDWKTTTRAVVAGGTLLMLTAGAAVWVTRPSSEVAAWGLSIAAARALDVVGLGAVEIIVPRRAGETGLARLIPGVARADVVAGIVGNPRFSSYKKSSTLYLISAAGGYFLALTLAIYVGRSRNQKEASSRLERGATAIDAASLARKLGKEGD